MTSGGSSRITFPQVPQGRRLAASGGPAGAAWQVGERHAAGRLGVHRHTVRNRLRRVEELLGRSLESAGVRAELWLALHV